jgi:hypothetical protein
MYIALDRSYHFYYHLERELQARWREEVLVHPGGVSGQVLLPRLSGPSSSLVTAVALIYDRHRIIADDKLVNYYSICNS